MRSSVLFSNRYRLAAVSWGAVCLMLAITLAWLWPRATVNSSVLALLPHQVLGQAPEALQQGFLQRLDGQMVWLISPGDAASPAAAAWWLARLQAMPALKQVQGPISAQQQQAWGTFAWQHRNNLIDPATRARLAQGGAAQADWVLAQLYSAFAGVSSQEITHDPLMLVRGAQLALQKNASQLTLRDGWLMSTDSAGRPWYFIHGELANNAFNMQQSHQLVQQLTALETQLQQRYPTARVVTRGTVLFSDYASQQARHDVSTLGVATVAGVLLLVFAVFRSLRPLALCALSVGVGALAGTTITLLCFGELHLMTLVMSLSIVGISADYTLYYLTERLIHGGQVSARQSLHKVLPALLLALSTTVLAYLIMLWAPFPALRQLAVFASSGLIAACLTVVCWYPGLVRGLPVRPVPATFLLARWLAAWRRNRTVKFGLPGLVLVLTVIGLATLKVNDDVAQLQALPQPLLHQDRLVTALTGQRADQTWFMVYGASAQQTLQRLEALAPHLQQARQEKWLSDYRLLPLASLQRQQQDAALLQQAAPAVMARLRAAGVQVSEPELTPEPVTVPAWLASPQSEGWRLLWLSLADGRSGVLVPVSGVNNSAALARLADSLPGVSWIDRKSTFDQLFGTYRLLLSGLLAAAVAVIALSYVLRLGFRAGLISIIPSLLSLGAGLAALSFGGHSLNLFSMLALILVLGIGINYTLFFSNPRATPVTSLLAILLAMTTTLLTLGMLVFSSTQAISSFGIVLCSGIFTAFLLAPLALPSSKRTPS
ncbi:MMPL family transporter [Paramixta manurensis]|uniref:MMPL family transporter n=2 Tax=Paramixta manurensis TaxID=2740817 RepID=A0A6M8U7M0_9GAMM|nr:MMPL family transporter [Erwiniaceae bacterium PD-1]